MIKDYTGSRFNFDTVRGNTVVIIHAWDVSPPCRELLELIDEVASLFSSTLFLRVSYRENRHLENEVGLTGMPTVVLFKNSRPIDSFMGVPSKSELISTLRKYY